MISTTDVIGWVGMILLLFAYLRISQGRVDSHNRAYQLTNFLGAIGVAISAFADNSWPAFGLEATWAAIAFFTLRRIWRNPTTA